MGFLIVFIAVGSIEVSVDNSVLLIFLVVAAFGLALMSIGTDSIKDDYK